ncbi:hypothetical protein [Pseudomonas putida]|uniref:Lipoprotein n=1 Tax=Pseudomonas putida TaxID=303 RepID=A0A1Q9RBN1_PSEPU|nr:hypothetical protein [Pseudomonas putida]OLS64840.1 hypothetical protein PSEMO_02630 [Pseudomonas putida]
MYRRLALLAVMGLMLAACAPYGGGGYYRTDVYSVDRYSYPAYPYGYNRGYYVAPQPRYYTPAPRYYRPAPVPYYRPAPPPRGGWDARGPGRPDNHGWNRGWERDHDRGDNRGHRDNRGDWRDRQNRQGDQDDRGRGRYH